MIFPFLNVNHTIIFIELINLLNIIWRQTEVEYINIIIDPFCSCGFRYRYDFSIDQISQDNLHSILVISVANFCESRIVEGWWRRVLLFLSIRHRTQRRVSDNSYPIFLAEFSQLLLGQVGVNLKLRIFFIIIKW